MARSKSVSFSEFIGKFCEKASGQGVNLKPRLEFMLHISNSVEKIQPEFLPNKTKLFVNYTDLATIKAKVPEGMVIKKKNARDSLAKAIGQINLNRTLNTEQIYRDIYAALGPQYFENYNELFDDKFKQWLNKSINKAQFENVAEGIPTMANQHQKLIGKFSKALKEIKRFKQDVDKFIDFAYPMIKSLLKSTCFKDQKEFVGQLDDYIIEIVKSQTQLSKSYKKLDEVLKQYNQKRSEWAEFFIGMRSSVAVIPEYLCDDWNSE